MSEDAASMMPASRELPGPRGWSAVRTLGSLVGSDLLRPFVGLAERYGPMFRIPLPLGQELVMIAHPDAVERVLRSHRDNYVKGSVYDGARILLGRGLVTAEGESWRRQRQLANPAFRPAALEQYMASIAGSTRGLLEDWQRRDAGSLDAQAEMTRLTLAIVGRTLFGLDLSDQSGPASHAFGAALEAIGRRGPASLQVPLWLPTPGNLRFRRVLRELDRLVYDVIARFRAGRAAGAERTLLGAYMAARDPATGEGMSDRQLRDEVITLYLAGHETTASLLAWSLYVLAREPEVARRLTAEADAADLGDPPSLEQVKAMEYGSRFVQEVLRLYPPAWTIGRNALAEDLVAGYRIPAGALVMVSPYLAHRLESFWPHPERFDPERFAPAA
ncbi:MAG: cytochrome P450, partial [Chromatiales bacterium]